MKKVVIVVPIYKETLSILEEISLEQMFRVLGKYEIVFLCPVGLSISLYEGGIRYEYFQREYFKGVEGYTKLMLSEEFYNRFIDYEYMLIYQTDAFVFSDRLPEFCESGYDYIGAPIKGFGWNYFHVGNGGFSLRKINSCIRVLEDFNHIISTMTEEERNTVIHAEDYFWGYCGKSIDIDFKVPDIWRAADFSVEMDVGHGFRKIPQNGLPFGMHHWHIMNYMTWKPFIEHYGYKLPECSGDNWETLDTDMKSRQEQMIGYICRHKSGYMSKLFENTCISSGDNIYIWGAGHDGKQIYKYLEKIDVIVIGFIDTTARGSVFNKAIYSPNELMNLSECDYVIVASRSHETEISLMLEKVGKGKIRYLNYSEIHDRMLRNLCRLFPGIPGITKGIMDI